MSTAIAQDYPKGKDLGATPPEKRKEVPHRKVTTRNLFKVPHGYPNGVAVAPEGVWVAEQKAQGYGKTRGAITEDAWLFDWNGKLLKTVHTPSSNTSGLAYGNGHVWMGANGGPEGVYEVDMQSRLISHRQIPSGARRQWRRLPWFDVARRQAVDRGQPVEGNLAGGPQQLGPGIHDPHHHRALAWHRLGRFPSRRGDLDGDRDLRYQPLCDAERQAASHHHLRADEI